MNLKMISNVVLDAFDLIIRILTIAVCFIDPNLYFYGYIMLFILWMPSFVIASTIFCCWQSYKSIGYYFLTILFPYPFLQILTRMKSLEETLLTEDVKDQILDHIYFTQLNIVSSSLQASAIGISFLKGDLAFSGKNLHL